MLLTASALLHVTLMAPGVVVSGPLSVKEVPVWVIVSAWVVNTTPEALMMSAPSPNASVIPVTPAMGMLTVFVPLPVAPVMVVVITSAESLKTKLVPLIATDRLLLMPLVAA